MSRAAKVPSKWLGLRPIVKEHRIEKRIENFWSQLCYRFGNSKLHDTMEKENARFYGYCAAGQRLFEYSVKPAVDQLFKDLDADKLADRRFLKALLRCKPGGCYSRALLLRALEEFGENNNTYYYILASAIKKLGKSQKGKRLLLKLWRSDPWLCSEIKEKYYREGAFKELPLRPMEENGRLVYLKILFNEATGMREKFSPKTEEELTILKMQMAQMEHEERLAEQRRQEKNAAAFLGYLSSLFGYLEYYIDIRGNVAQENDQLAVLRQKVLDHSTLRIIDDLESSHVKEKNLKGIESLSVDKSAKSRINEFLGLVKQGDLYQANKMIPSLRASLGIHEMPAAKA